MSLTQYLNKNSKKHLIFDFDGTLFNMVIDWYIFRAQLREILQDLDSVLAEEHKPYKSGGMDRTINVAIKKYGDVARDKIFELQQKFEVEYIKKLMPNDELIEFIRKHGSKYHLSIWSNNHMPIITKALTESRINDKFETIASRETYKLSKPEPDGFQVIFDPQLHAKSEFLFIGNSDNDAGAAKAVGIDFYKIMMIH